VRFPITFTPVSPKTDLKSMWECRFAGNDDSDEELDEEAIEDWLNQGRTGVNGELNEEENEQLNPLKTAYMTGWNRAAAEEGG